MKSKSRVIPAMAGPTLKGVPTCSRSSLLHPETPDYSCYLLFILYCCSVVSKIPKVPEWWDLPKGPGRQSSNLNTPQAPEICSVSSSWQQQGWKDSSFLVKGNYTQRNISCDVTCTSQEEIRANPITEPLQSTSEKM